MTAADRARVRRVLPAARAVPLLPGPVLAAQEPPSADREALAELRDARTASRPSLVLRRIEAPGRSGSENFSRVMARADELGIRAAVHHLGYVPAEDMPALYAEASRSACRPSSARRTSRSSRRGRSTARDHVRHPWRPRAGGQRSLPRRPDLARATLDAIRRVWLEEDTLDGGSPDSGRPRLEASTRRDDSRVWPRSRQSGVLDKAASLVSRPGGPRRVRVRADPRRGAGCWRCSWRAATIPAETTSRRRRS